MSDSLLTLSGPAFSGSIDITTYSVYGVVTSSSANTAFTIFSEVSWTWCLLDIHSGYGTVIRPIPIVRSSISTTAGTLIGYQNTNNQSDEMKLIATATSLVSSVRGRTSVYEISAFIPSN